MSARQQAFAEIIGQELRSIEIGVHCTSEHLTKIVAVRRSNAVNLIRSAPGDDFGSEANAIEAAIKELIVAAAVLRKLASNGVTA
jgi:hypothetical protein